MPSQRILYVGLDHTLLFFLRDVLKKIDTEIVRCPSGSCSFCLIKSDIKYALLLFDDELPDMSGVELAQFTRKLKHRAATPIVILSKEKARGMVAGLFFEKPYDVGSVVGTITAGLQDSKT
ncbi:MAG: response regulator [Pyrinomonadaceae bacterium]